MDNGQFEEFATSAKHYVDLVEEDNELPSRPRGNVALFQARI